MKKKAKPKSFKPKPKAFKGVSKPLVYGPRVNPTKRSAKTETKTGG